MDRQVTRSGKDRDGDITALCNSGEYWSPRKKWDAIHDIESGTHTYFVRQPGTTRTSVRVVNSPNGKYLRTTADAADANNLDNLPDC
jgi:hypothetical protein